MSTVGVVVRTFEAAATLPSALASLAGQERRPDAVVVVDDASTDDGATIGESWADRLPIVVRRHEVNQGPAAALRTGMSALDCDLVTDLDADDIWFPDHLSTVVELHNKVGGLVSADSLNWMPGIAVSTRSWYARRPPPEPARQLSALAADNWVFSSVIMERSLYDEVGGYRDLPACEDWDLWLRAVDRGARVHVAPSPTMLYRQHGTTVSKGSRACGAAVALLEDFAAMTSHDSARAVAQRSARRWRGAEAVHVAYERARLGDHSGARRAALKALGGGTSLALRAAALTLAPRRATELHDRLVADPRRRVNASG